MADAADKIKGVFPNPGGRTKVEQLERLEFQKLIPEARTVLRMIMLDDKRRASDRIKAANSILDRAVGRPIQPIDVGVREPDDVPMDLSWLGEENLRRMREQHLAASVAAANAKDMPEGTN